MITVRDRVLNKDIINILYDVRGSCHNGKLDKIIDRGEEIQVTCPSHSGGRESRPSCFIRVEDGVFHCFTCGTKGYLPKFVSECFERSVSWAEDWLISNYTDDFVENRFTLPKIILNSEGVVEQEKYLDESILDNFESYHPYMLQRHLTKEVIDKYEIKYDPETKCLVFPVRDLNNNLKFLTRRSVTGKAFIIDKNADKSDIYLLNTVQDQKTVFVVEAQLSALVMNGWGYPTIALFGAGTSEEQVEALNKTNIRRFILCYDNDPAGLKGESRFKKFIDNTKFVDTIRLPQGKDPNDLTKEEFDSIISLQLGRIYV